MLLFYKGFISLLSAGWMLSFQRGKHQAAGTCRAGMGLALAGGRKGWEALCPLRCIPPEAASPEITAQEIGRGQVLLCSVPRDSLVLQW